MTKQELERLKEIEARVCEIFKEKGLLTTDITFEIVPSQRMFEAMAYHFPVNFSHWSFGRDYEKQRMIYEHTGGGIPYEVVWNFDHPKAFLVETNPFALNVIIIAHVFGHVDFHLANGFAQHSRKLADIAQDARLAADRFAKYEERHRHEVERIIDAGMSIAWHQHMDPFYEEEDEEDVRERLIELERAKLVAKKTKGLGTKNPPTQDEIDAVEKRLEELSLKTPPEPVYDLLWYIIKKSPRPLRPWMKDVLKVIREQARCLAPMGRTKLLNEGWATYCHVNIMNQLLRERMITDEEYGTFLRYHNGVIRPSKSSLNWYRVGLALFEDIKRRWDMGHFGKEYEECEDPIVKANWNTHANKGDQKILQVRASFSNRLAVEEFFTDDFIRAQELYIYLRGEDPDKPGVKQIIVAEDRPHVIRGILRNAFTYSGVPVVTVEDGNFKDRRYLSLKHHIKGFELDPEYRDGTLRKIRHLWGRNVFLETPEGDRMKVFIASGKGEIKSFEV
jgi:stage V sporulation protein R